MNKTLVGDQEVISQLTYQNDNDVAALLMLLDTFHPSKVVSFITSMKKKHRHMLVVMLMFLDNILFLMWFFAATSFKI